MPGAGLEPSGSTAERAGGCCARSPDGRRQGPEGVEARPSITELDQCADDLAEIVTELNESRLRGDLAKITGREIKDRRETSA
jgi:hypothetical protein